MKAIFIAALVLGVVLVANVNFCESKVSYLQWEGRGEEVDHDDVDFEDDHHEENQSTETISSSTENIEVVDNLNNTENFSINSSGSGSHSNSGSSKPIHQLKQAGCELTILTIIILGLKICHLFLEDGLSSIFSLGS